VPDPYERHARAKDSSGWENQSPRSARAAAAAEPVAKRPPARKDPDLCKATHWKAPHEPKFVLREHSWKRTGCRWSISWTRVYPEWFCLHEKRCAGCGKVLSVFVGQDQCPDFHEMTAEEQLELDRDVEKMQERWRARGWRKPVIDGPQGYRKQKKE
jgi:hypothetical protein